MYQRACHGLRDRYHVTRLKCVHTHVFPWYGMCKPRCVCGFLGALPALCDSRRTTLVGQEMHMCS
jgi:hypothetical protein